MSDIYDEIDANARPSRRKPMTCRYCWEERQANVLLVTNVTFDNRSVEAVLTAQCPECEYSSTMKL